MSQLRYELGPTDKMAPWVKMLAVHSCPLSIPALSSIPWTHMAGSEN